MPLAGLPVIPYGLGGAEQVLLGDAVADAIDDVVHDGDVVALGLVVAEAVEAPPLLGVHVGLDDALVEGVAEALEGLPLGVLEVHVGVVLVAVGPAAAVVGEQLDGGLGLVVDEGAGDALGALPLVGLDGGEGEPPDEVDRVLLGVLPLENVRVGAGLVLALEAGEDEAVVAVLEVADDLVEHHLDAVGELHGLLVDEEGLVLALARELVHEAAVGLEDLLLEVAQALAELAVHEDLAVEDETVEDEVARLLAAVAQGVDDELAVEDGGGVELHAVVGEGEVEVAAVDEPVVILPVDEVVDLLAVLVLGHVEQVAHAV